MENCFLFSFCFETDLIKNEFEIIVRHFVPKTFGKKKKTIFDLNSLAQVFAHLDLKFQDLINCSMTLNLHKEVPEFYHFGSKHFS